MLAKVLSAAIDGIDAYVLEIEVDLSNAPHPNTVVVGLPDAAVRESRDRVRPAIVNSGYLFPGKKVTINLAPGDVKKEGAGFDLPMAIGILLATEQLSTRRVAEYAILGELALDGTVRPVNGVLSAAIAAREKGLKGVIVPKENAREAAVIADITTIPVADLIETVNFLAGRMPIDPELVALDQIFEGQYQSELDFSEVRGQEHVKRALTVACAGGHNCLLIGPPGTGKTMLAKRVPSILPRLTFEESLETTRIHSVAGLLPPHGTLLALRPFRSPHHGISDPGLVGGGREPRPGEVTLAHNGVLFLDELPEFKRSSLESLRQPLEDHVITVSRAAASNSFPCRIMLIAAMNPCPCGFHGDTRRSCNCTFFSIEKYLSKVSGPLLDRIDIQIEVPAVRFEDLSGKREGESSTSMREKVNRARETQTKRYYGSKTLTNSGMNNKQVREFCKLDAPSEELLRSAMNELSFSARGHHKVLKVARTIADLENSENIRPEHVSEAIQYRNLDRKILS